MNNASISRQSRSTAIRCALSLAALVTLCADGSRSTASAAEECYGFDNLPLDTRYEVGDTIVAAHSLIRIKPYYSDIDNAGDPSEAEFRHADLHQGNNAGGESAPSFRFYLVNAEITPTQPVQRVSFRWGDAAHLPIDLRVNAEKYVIEGGLETADGRQLGRPNIGLVRIHVTPIDESKSEVVLEAESGHIRSIEIGGHETFMDDVCLSL